MGGAPQKMNDFMEEQRQFPGQNVTNNQRNNNKNLYKFSFSSIMLNIQVYGIRTIATEGEEFAQFLATSKLTSYKRRSQHCSNALVCKYLLEDLLGSLEGLNKSLMNILEQFFYKSSNYIPEQVMVSHGRGVLKWSISAVPGIQLLWWFARTLSREKTGDSWFIELIHQGKSRWHSHHVLDYISHVLTHLLGTVPCTLIIG